MFTECQKSKNNHFSDLKTLIMVLITETKKMGYFEYTPLADKAIQNFKNVGTVRVFKNMVFIQNCSFHFFIELLKRETPITIQYKLSWEPNHVKKAK